VPLFLMHESNAMVIYSQKLSEQIPRSYAAHAFDQQGPDPTFVSPDAK
jgi:hypothetical protein